jgi:hypothetical protein
MGLVVLMGFDSLILFMVNERDGISMPRPFPLLASKREISAFLQPLLLTFLSRN